MKDNEKIALIVIGGTGYGAAEALRICALHPLIEVVSVVSASSPGEQIAESHPHLASFYSGSFAAELDISLFEGFTKKAVLLALPHGTAAAYARTIRKRIQKVGAVLLDLSGDFRLTDAQIREQYYPGVTETEQKGVVYGLPELNRAEIATATELSTPGCLASVVSLAGLPLFHSDLLVEGLVVADAKTGTSGAGRALAQSYHHPTRHDNANAYKVLEHRHEPEILQNWGKSNSLSSRAGSGGNDFSFMFVPHVMPCSRGCMATVYAQLSEDITEARVRELYAEYYREHPFIRLREEAPQLQHVVGTNFCDIAVFVRGRQVVAIAALDNLVRGAAGQAIQNCNIRFGLDERLGLHSPALGPSA